MKKGTRFLALLALLIGFCALALPGSMAETDAARLVCLNIGKADCMLLQYQNQNFLIDAGYEATYPALAEMLSQYQASRLNGVILTHCHQDHQGGLEALSQSSIDVDAWYAGAYYTGVKLKKHPLVKAATRRGQETVWLRAGDSIPVGSDGTLTVLAPLSLNEDNENNNSLVLLFSCPAGRMLLAGDMKEEEEAALVAAGTVQPVQVLKVGHHGGGKASTLPFLQQAQPQMALILTATQEETDTPAQSTLQNLRTLGCETYVSQDFQDALEVTLANGQAKIRDVAWDDVPARAQDMLLSMNVEADTLTIQNSGGEDVSLAGWTVYSTKGNETLTLPEVTLSAGASYCIGSRATETACDLRWDEKRVWHETKRDQAILYDAYGRPVAYADNGIAE